MRPSGRERERLLFLRKCAMAIYWQWHEDEKDGYQPTADEWELMVSYIAHLNMEIFRGL